jgi:rubrerythrin
VEGRERMTKKSDDRRMVISDIIEPEQEDKVIEAVGGIVKKERAELKEYFMKTDTIQLEGLSRDEAERLVKKLEETGVSVEVSSYDEAGETESGSVRCPQCGCAVEGGDWRCPECYFEFPDYEFRQDA